MYSYHQEKSAVQKEIHPLFSEMNSDHLPVCTSIKGLNLLSYNVMGAMSANNVLSTAEDEKAAKERYQRIAIGLKKCTEMLNIDCVLLQEVIAELIVGFIKDSFSDDWKVIEDRQQLIIYKSSTLRYINHTLDMGRKTLSGVFEISTTKKIVHLHNVWSEYNIFPDLTEQYYRKLLLDKRPGELVIVFGDTNSRIAPVEGVEQNLTTTIIPPAYNAEYNMMAQEQIPDHPDGGFYSEDEKIHQINHRIVSLTNGIILPPQPVKALTEADEKMRDYYRPVLCLDNHYQSFHLPNEKTIFEYEAFLKAKLHDDNILVRVATTIFNKKALSIRFSSRSEVFKALFEGCQNETSIFFMQLNSGMYQFPCIFVCFDRLKDFIEKLELICIKTKKLGENTSAFCHQAQVEDARSRAPEKESSQCIMS